MCYWQEHLNSVGGDLPESQAESPDNSAKRYLYMRISKINQVPKLKKAKCILNG